MHNWKLFPLDNSKREGSIKEMYDLFLQLSCDCATLFSCVPITYCSPGCRKPDIQQDSRRPGVCSQLEQAVSILCISQGYWWSLRKTILSTSISESLLSEELSISGCNICWCNMQWSYLSKPVSGMTSRMIALVESNETELLVAI